MRYVTEVSEDGRHLKTAALLTVHEWENMTTKLDQVRLQEESQEVRTVLEKERRDKSLMMTKNWPSTMASVKKDRERRFAEALKKDADEKQRQYDEIIKRRAEEKSEVLEKARKLVNDQKDTSKTLLSGLIHAKVLAERQKQIHLKQLQWLKKQQKNTKEVEDLRRQAEEYKIFHEQEKNYMIKKKEKTMQMLNEQFEEHKEKHTEWLKEKEEEALDMEHMNAELKQINEEETQKQIDRKIKLRQDQDSFMQITEKYRQEKRSHEKEEEEVNAIYCHVRDKLEKERKEKEKQIRDEMIKIRQKLALRTIELPDYSKEEEEQRKAIEKQEEEYQKEVRERDQKKDRLRKELLEFQTSAERALKLDGERKLEEQRWELLQRLAIEDATKQWERKEANLRAEKKEKVKNDLMTQWQEREENGFRRKIEEIKQFERDCQQDHSDLLKRCDEMLQCAQEENLPIIPIKSAITRVKKDVGLTDEKKDTSFLKSRVPIRSVALYD